MSNKADLTELLAEISGSARHKKPAAEHRPRAKAKAAREGQGRDQSHHRSLPEAGPRSAQDSRRAERQDAAQACGRGFQ